MIPAHLVSGTITHIKSKVDEITKIVGFHRKKYFTEHHSIGLLTHQDDLIIHELSIRFKEHQFVVLDSLERLSQVNSDLDMVILTRDIFQNYVRMDSRTRCWYIPCPLVSKRICPSI